MASSIGAAVALAGLRQPNPAFAEQTDSSQVLAERIVGACGPGYGLELSPSQLSDGLARYVETAGHGTVHGFLDRVIPDLAAFDDGVLASSAAREALCALDRSATVEASWYDLLNAGLQSHRTFAVAPRSHQIPLKVGPTEHNPEQERAAAVLNAVRRLMSLAVAGAGLEVRDLELVRG